MHSGQGCKVCHLCYVAVHRSAACPVVLVVKSDLLRDDAVQGVGLPAREGNDVPSHQLDLTELRLECGP